MTESDAAKLVQEITNILRKKGQWYNIEYKHKGDELSQILIKDISIKITK